MVENTDEKIANLLDIIHTQRHEVDELEQATKQPWQTTCTIHLNDTIYNIQTQPIDNIRELYAKLLEHFEYLKKSSAILDIEYIDKYHNYTLDDWTVDFKKRIAIIQIKNKKQQLDELESRLNALITPEYRRKLELDAITKTLGV